MKIRILKKYNCFFSKNIAFRVWLKDWKIHWKFFTELKKFSLFFNGKCWRKMENAGKKIFFRGFMPEKCQQNTENWKLLLKALFHWKSFFCVWLKSWKMKITENWKTLKSYLYYKEKEIFLKKYFLIVYVI